MHCLLYNPYFISIFHYLTAYFLTFNLIWLQNMLTRISLNFMFLSFSESWMVYQNEFCWIITYGQKYTSEKKAHNEIQLSLQVMLWKWIDYCCIYPLDNYYLCKHAFNYNSETRVINYVLWCFYRTYYTYIISPIVSSWQIYTFSTTLNSRWYHLHYYVVCMLM